MTTLRKLGTDIKVFPLALGTNVFGWTADMETSHAVLDGYVAGGGNFIDTADSYSFWVPGNPGGVSETIIGQWMANRSDRADLVIASKVSQHPDFTGLGPSTIIKAIDESLRRLQMEYLDIYFAHYDDAATPLEESIAAMSSLVDAGKIRSIGVSNFTPERIAEWLTISEREGFHKPVVLQPQYSLVERAIELDVVPLALQNNIGIMSYYSLASGFLTGKYTGNSVVNSPRAGGASRYLTPLGYRILDALAQVAEAHSAPQATIALAWIAAQPGVTAPIASARNIGQLPALLAHADVVLTDVELSLLTNASDPTLS